MRDYAVPRLREQRPTARIIHELVVGRCRADLAAVEPDHIALFEIKSEKDTLKRLPDQVEAFARASHEVVVIAHERWFDKTPYNNGNERFVPSTALAETTRHRHTIWAFPETERAGSYYSHWRMDTFARTRPQPRAADMLSLLWKDELLEEAFQHRIAASSRNSMENIIRDMAWLMSGREIARAVCRQLRSRQFPEADAPIVETAI
jgi:hypothetical protein